MHLFFTQALLQHNNTLKDLNSLQDSEALLFAYDLHDLDSLKLVFTLYNHLKPTLTQLPIPLFLVAVTKDNVSETSIHDMRTLKVYQLAERMMKEH